MPRTLQIWNSTRVRACALALACCWTVALALALTLAPATGAATSAGVPGVIASPCTPPRAGTPPPLANRPAEADADNVELDGELVVSPPAMQETSGELQPGTWLVCTIRLRSRFAEATTFQLTPLGVRGSHARGAGLEYVEATDDGFDRTAGSWLTTATDQVTLAPRAVLDVPIAVTVPKDAAVGAAYGAIYIAPATPATVEGKTNLGVQSGIAVQVLLDVGGKGRSKLHLRDVRAPLLRWNREGWPLHATLDNDGTTFATPRGRVRIRSIFGNTVRELPLATTAVLPGGRARLDVRWNGVPWIGVYRYDVRVANAEKSGANDPVARSSGWLIAMPPVWMLALAALLLAALMWRLRNRNGGMFDVEDDPDELDDLDEHDA